MRTPCADDHPLVCRRVLDGLAEELGVPTASEFVLRFTGSWTLRLSRLETAVTHQDPATGIDAALSLKSGASMAGALRLAALASCIHQGLRQDGRFPPTPEACAEMLGRLRSVGCRTVTELKRVAAELQGGQPRPN